MPRLSLADWADNENIPPRLALSGASSVTRYKATDGKRPSWLATYDTANLGVFESDEYKVLMANTSESEKSTMSRLVTLNRRMYTRLTTVRNPDRDASALPAKFTLVVGVNPTPDKEEEVNRWYEEEHLKLMSKVPGFIRARRYKLVSSVELGGKADVNAPIAVFPYITLYDWENDGYAAEPAHKEATSTPWSAKVRAGLTSAEGRTFALHKSFSK